mmetsp:Transcript_62828/g.205091  ORF Transcript_62828/g.205091 Transcript_62828/m.205091 type:complete len:244 (-) Transcript_62828:84-815(-)
MVRSTSGAWAPQRRLGASRSSWPWCPWRGPKRPFRAAASGAPPRRRARRLRRPRGRRRTSLTGPRSSTRRPSSTHRPRRRSSSRPRRPSWAICPSSTRHHRPWAISSLAPPSAAPSAPPCTPAAAQAVTTGFWRTSSARMSAKWTGRPPSSRTCSASWPSSRSRSEIGNSPVGSRGFTRMRPTRLFRHHEPPFFGRRPSRVRAPLFVFGPSSWLPIARGQHRTRVETDFSLTACALAARVIRA